MTKVKYCGLRNERDIQLAIQLGIDYIGFVVVPESKRFVTVDQIVVFQRLLERLETTVEPVLVMMDLSAEDTIELATKTKVSHLQLAGNESADFCRQLKEDHSYTIWKSWHVSVDDDGSGSEEEANELCSYLQVVDGILLDTSYQGKKGGTGTTFHWEVINRYQQMMGDVPMIVAGGLTPDNVKALIDRYRPFAVDVSSGIESDGIKDQVKMKDFALSVREANHESGQFGTFR